MRLSDVLNKLMQESNINNLQLARYTSVPVTNIARMRKDNKVNPKTSSLKAIADFFNISVDQLLGLQDLPKNKQEGIHTTLNYTAALLPIIEWHKVIEFLDHPQNFLKGKILKWVSSTREFPDNSYAVSIPDNDRALFLKAGSVILIEIVKEIKKNGIALFIEDNNKQIGLYQVVVDGKDVYIKSTNPEIKGLKLLQDNNMKLLGSVAEIRFSFQEKEVDSTDEVRSALPFYTEDKLADNQT